MRSAAWRPSSAVGVAVDDYGTGYSSLSYLRSLPNGAFRIDRSFVSHMLQDEGSHMIVRSTIEVAHNLGLTVVAEGGQDAATYTALAQMRCDSAQGYHISHPLPAASVQPFSAPTGSRAGRALAWEPQAGHGGQRLSRGAASGRAGRERG